jgi:hypothetical protein
VNPDHLFLGTRQDNMDDMVRKGRADRVRKAYGEKSSFVKLTADQVRDILNNHGHLEAKKVATIFGVSSSNIGAIRRGKSWVKAVPRGTTP